MVSFLASFFFSTTVLMAWQASLRRLRDNSGIKEESAAEVSDEGHCPSSQIGPKSCFFTSSGSNPFGLFGATHFWFGLVFAGALQWLLLASLLLLVCCRCLLVPLLSRLCHSHCMLSGALLVNIGFSTLPTYSLAVHRLEVQKSSSTDDLAAADLRDKYEQCQRDNMKQQAMLQDEIDRLTAQLQCREALEVAVHKTDTEQIHQ